MQQTKRINVDRGTEQESLRIMITGGTFDKHYDPLRGELGFSNTHLPEIIDHSRCTLPIIMELIQLTDSLYMTSEDRQAILHSCSTCSEERIIITHGTDTMTETARVLGEAGLDKCIVLTGAMVPYSIVGSDAVFNLGAAVAAVQLARPGVWICMNGQLFPWDRVVKDRDQGVFLPLA